MTTLKSCWKYVSKNFKSGFLLVLELQMTRSFALGFYVFSDLSVINIICKIWETNNKGSNLFFQLDEKQTINNERKWQQSRIYGLITC